MQARSFRMFLQYRAAHLLTLAFNLRRKSFLVLLVALQLFGAARIACAQALERELEAGEKATISIKNRNGRVRVTASDDQKGVSLKAESAGASVSESDVVSTVHGSLVEIDVREQRAENTPLRATTVGGMIAPLFQISGLKQGLH